MGLKKLTLYLTFLVFIVPTTIVAAVTSIFAIPFALASIGSTGQESATAMFLALTFGWTGIISSWKLFLHFRKEEKNPSRIFVYCTGLFFGMLVSIFLVFSSGGTAFFRIFFFGWPIFGALVLYGFLLFNFLKNPR